MSHIYSKEIAEKYHETFYSEVIGVKGTGIVGFLSRYPHKLMEKNITHNADRILEVGFGEGEHFKFVKSPFKQYIGIDLDRRKLLRSEYPKHIKTKVMDAQKIDYPDSHFDRVIATCLIAHLQNPEVALHEWRRVLKRDGLCTIYVPMEPSVALKLFRIFVMKPKLRRMGFNSYDLFIAAEHINHASRIMFFIKNVFENDEIKISMRPFPIKIQNINLFAVFYIRKLS
jgi:phosphatidylethanolamine/phosphatidyl-N-methylethanolamine N-methyltransferase